MARILYALSGQGRGHTSRVLAVTHALQQRGHDLHFACGGQAREILTAQGYPVLPVPALRQEIIGNRLSIPCTVSRNWKRVVFGPRIVGRIAEAMRALQPDLLLTDFEAYTPRAAARIGLPVMSFNHQQVVTETRYELPLRYRLNAAFIAASIKQIAPANPVHVLLTSFFYPPLKHPERTTLVPPIIRQDVQNCTPTLGDHVVVYFNDTRGTDAVVETLSQVDARFVLYNFTPPENPDRYPNLTFKAPDMTTFVQDLASARAVICTAGFTLISESLYLGKPALVVPNGGIFEQTLNALFLEREGLGEAVYNRTLRPEDVTGFLQRVPGYTSRLGSGYDRKGNAAAVTCIEKVLYANAPRPHYLSGTRTSAAAPVS